MCSHSNVSTCSIGASVAFVYSKVPYTDSNSCSNTLRDFDIMHTARWGTYSIFISKGKISLSLSLSLPLCGAFNDVGASYKVYIATVKELIQILQHNNVARGCADTTLQSSKLFCLEVGYLASGFLLVYFGTYSSHFSFHCQKY